MAIAGAGQRRRRVALAPSTFGRGREWGIASYRRPARPFSVTTEDGVELVGHRVGAGAPAVVLCHGFLGSHRKARMLRFQEELARWFTVLAFDFRGHGQSGGISSFGACEEVDVDAVVRHARREGHDRIWTLGGSMGGIAVIRHAALRGGVSGVVAASTPATWNGHDTDAVRRIRRVTGTARGRWLLYAWGVRVARGWQPAEAALEVVDRVAPTPLVLVHGRDDHYFSEEDAWLLYRRAQHPKRLLLASRFGHAEDGYTAAFAEAVARVILEIESR